MAQRVNRLRNNIFVNPPPLSLLGEISRILHLAQPDLTAGWLAGKMQKRKHLYNKAKSNGSEEVWLSYRKIRNEITKEINEAHKAYQEKLFDHDTNFLVIKTFGDILGDYVRIILELPH